MSTMTRRIATTAFTLLLALFATAVPAQLDAQDAENRGRQVMPEAPPIEDGEMETFAEVYLVVAEIRADLQAEVDDTSTPQEAQQLQQAAQMEMREALSESPLTIERYTQIGQILNVDPEQRAEFQALLEAMQDESGVR